MIIRSTEMIGKGAAYLKAVLGTGMIVTRPVLSGYGCSSLTSAVVFTGVLVRDEWFYCS